MQKLKEQNDQVEKKRHLRKMYYLLLCVCFSSYIANKNPYIL